MLVKKVVKFFDKLEDIIRLHLSKYPILYGLLAGIGVVLFWRGVWHTADQFAFMNGPISFVIGAVILLMIGAFVSSFIGSSLLISNLKSEKKTTEKTVDELKKEETEIEHIERMLSHIDTELAEIKEEATTEKK